MKPLFWMGSSLKDLKALPDEVQRVIGRELMDVQFGGQPLNAKPLKGLGPRIYEILEDLRYEHVSRRLHGEIRRRGICPARVPEEERSRRRDPAA